MNWQWKEVEGASDIPVGNWLVTLEDGTVHTCKCSQISNGTMPIIGGKFHFDCEEVIAIMPQPEPFTRSRQ